jgi:streptogramin lyase
VTGRFGSMRVLACVGMLAAGCGGGDDDTASTETAEPSPATASATGGATVTAATVAVATTQPLPTEGLIAEIEVLGGPDWLAVDDHGVWAKDDNGSVVLIDPATNTVLDTVDVDVGGELCQGLGAGDGSVWACSGPDVARIDAGHPEVLSVIPVGKTYTQGNLGVAEGQVWLLIGDGSTLHGYLTDTQDLWSRFALPMRGTDLGVGAAGLWVISTVDDAVIHVDMDTGHVLDRIDVQAPVDIAVDNGVWIGTQTESVRVDVASGTIDLRVPVGTGDDGSITTTPGEVWIQSIEPLMTRVDRETGSVIDTYTADVTNGGDSVYAFGSVWASAYDDATIFRFAAPG